MHIAHPSSLIKSSSSDGCRLWNDDWIGIDRGGDHTLKNYAATYLSWFHHLCTVHNAVPFPTAAKFIHVFADAQEAYNPCMDC